MDSFSPSVVPAFPAFDYSIAKDLLQLEDPNFFKQNDKQIEAAQVLFREQNGRAWVVIVKQPSGEIKAYLEKEGREKSLLNLKGFPPHLKTGHVRAAEETLKNSHYKLIGDQLELILRIRGGGFNSRSNRFEEPSEMIGRSKLARIDRAFSQINDSPRNPLALFILSKELLRKEGSSSLLQEINKRVHSHLDKDQMEDKLIEDSARLGFAPAQYQWALKNKNGGCIEKSVDYYESLKQGHWEAVQGLLLVNTFDFGVLEVLDLIWDARNKFTFKGIFDEIVTKVGEKFNFLINRIEHDLYENSTTLTSQKSLLAGKIRDFIAGIEKANIANIEDSYNAFWQSLNGIVNLKIPFAPYQKDEDREDLKKAIREIDDSLKQLVKPSALHSEDIFKVYKVKIIKSLEFLNQEKIKNIILNDAIENANGSPAQVKYLSRLKRRFENRCNESVSLLKESFDNINFEKPLHIGATNYIQTALELISTVVFSECLAPLFKENSPNGRGQVAFMRQQSYMKNIISEALSSLKNFSAIDFYQASILAAELGLEGMSYTLAAKTQELEYCKSILNSKLAIAIFEKRLIKELLPFKGTDQLEALIRNPEDAYYPKNVKKAKAFIQKIDDENLKRYTYMQLAKLVSRYESFEAEEKLNLTKELVKAANQCEELAYYLLLLAKAKTGESSLAEITGYLKNTGWLRELTEMELSRIEYRNKAKSINVPSVLENEYQGLVDDIVSHFIMPRAQNKATLEKHISQLIKVEALLKQKAIESDVKTKIGVSFKEKFPMFLWLRVFSGFNLRAMRKQWSADFNFKENNNKFINLDYKEENYNDLSKKIATEKVIWAKETIAEIIDGLKKTIGKSPPNFSLFIMGSLAREESGPYTNFEAGILLEQNTIEAQEYFSFFTQQLMDCLCLSGRCPETGKYGTYLDIARNTTPPHKAFTTHLSGSRIYLTDYESFARLFSKEKITTFSRIFYSKDNLSQKIYANVKERFLSAVDCFDEEGHIKIGNKNRFTKNFPKDAFKAFEYGYKKMKTSLLNLSAIIQSNNSVSIEEEAFSNFIAQGPDHEALIKTLFQESQEDVCKQHGEGQRAHIKAITDLLKREPESVTGSLDEINIAENVKESLRSVKCIYSYYNQDLDSRNVLFDRFVKLKTKYLREVYLTEHSCIKLTQEQAISIKAIKNILNSSEAVEPLFDSQKLTSRLRDYLLPKKIDLNLQFYRITEQLLTSLYCFYRASFNPEEEAIQNSEGIIKKLKEYGIFSKAFARDFQTLVNITTRIRFKHRFNFSSFPKNNEIYFDEVLWKTDLEMSREKTVSDLSLLEKASCESMKDTSYLESLGPNWLSSTQDSQEDKEWEIKNFSIAFSKLRNIITKTTLWVNEVHNKISQTDYREVKAFGGRPEKVITFFEVEEPSASSIFDASSSLARDVD